eukprot:ctg_1874.g476
MHGSDAEASRTPLCKECPPCTVRIVPVVRISAAAGRLATQPSAHSCTPREGQGGGRTRAEVREPMRRIDRAI